MKIPIYTQAIQKGMDTGIISGASIDEPVKLISGINGKR